MKSFLWFSRLILLAVVATVSVWASAAHVYVAQGATGSGDGSSCANAQPYTFFNTASNWGTGASQIGPGTTVHVCGTITGVAGSTALTFQGSGASDAPITLIFEPGAILQAPYWAASSGGGCGGAICMAHRSHITVDGGTNGVVRNTANGSELGFQQNSEAIAAYECDDCTVKNLSITDIFVNVINHATVDETQMKCIEFSGSNWKIHNNNFNDAGWCLFQNFADGDQDIHIYNNKLSNITHGWMLATASPVAASNIFFYGNEIYDTSNWDAGGCPYHHDGIHVFGVPGSTLDNLYVYDNYFHGNWGSCSTGFIFVEGGSSSSHAHVRNSYWWNNVMTVDSGNAANTNGWFGLFAGDSGSQHVYNNTIIGANDTDNTNCISIHGLSGLIFENNLISNCGNPLAINASTIEAVNFNFYGDSCLNGGNCFAWNGQYTGSFPNWKNACACDSDSVRKTGVLLAADGAPEADSPLNIGRNLTVMVEGNLSSLSNDTNRGGTRTSHPRPLSGLWATGAYVLPEGSTSPELQPPSGLTAATSQ